MDRDNDVAVETVSLSGRERTSCDEEVTQSSSETQLGMVEGENIAVPQPRIHNGCHLEVEVLEKHAKECRKRQKQMKEIQIRQDKHQLQEEDVQGSFLVIDRVGYDICPKPTEEPSLKMCLPLKSSKEPEGEEEVTMRDETTPDASISPKKSSMKSLKPEYTSEDDIHPLLRRSRRGMRLNEPEQFYAPLPEVRSKIERIPLLQMIGCSQGSFVCRMLQTAPLKIPSTVPKIKSFMKSSTISSLPSFPSAPPPSRSSKITLSFPEQDEEKESIVNLMTYEPSKVQLVYTSTSNTQSPFTSAASKTEKSFIKESSSTRRTSRVSFSDLKPDMKPSASIDEIDRTVSEATASGPSFITTSSEKLSLKDVPVKENISRRSTYSPGSITSAEMPTCPLTKRKHYIGDPCILNRNPTGRFHFNQPAPVVMGALIHKQKTPMSASAEAEPRKTDQDKTSSVSSTLKPLSMLYIDTSDCREIKTGDDIMSDLGELCVHNMDAFHTVIEEAPPEAYLSSSEEEMVVEESHQDEVCTKSVEKKPGLFARMFPCCAKKKKETPSGVDDQK
ncbi:uncharacterized protein [Periplaneta americana]|uniref:uncharacterized protein n=1 Tax=Periplaneta americana TaxID=6978 RepID=UPI0037E9141D